MPIKLANNASGTTATAISASDTGLVLTTGNGAEFPTLGVGDYFYATLASSGGTLEIVKATARSGDSLTVVRAQEGTTAQSFAAGSRFELRVTAASVNDRADLAESEANTYALGLDTALRVDLAASSGSSLVGFQPAGVGAVPTTVQAKLRESVSVKDFGAVGDGVTNDTVAIQACWDFCRTNNRTAWVPTGVYRIAQTNIAYGMTIIGEAGATFKLLDNQGKFVRMLTMQNNLWSATTPTEDSPVLTIRGITLDGNRVNQGPYTGYEKGQQSMLFLHGGPGGLFGRSRARVVLDNCVFKESCSDGTAVWHDVDVSINNCFYWNCFRGSVVIIGGNNITRVTNIHAGGDVHNSFFQVEQEGTISGELTLTNSTFETLRGNDQAGTGLDLGFKPNSKITVSNCIFNAGIVRIFGRTSSFDISNCVFRMLDGGDILVDYGKTTFSNCRFINTLANTSGRVLNYRRFNATEPLELVFSGCSFDSEFDPITQLTPLTITAVTEISNGVFEFTTSSAHNIPAPGNFTYDSIIIRGLTDNAYNKAYRVDSTPTATTFRVQVTEYVGPPALGATPLAYLATAAIMPDAIASSIAQPATSVLAVQGCSFSEKLDNAISISSGILRFQNNFVGCNYALSLFATNNPLNATVGPNQINTGWLIASQGNLVAGANRFNFFGFEAPAKSGFIRFAVGGSWLDSEVTGKITLLSNRARPNNSQQRSKFVNYGFSIAAIGTPNLYANNGTAWFAQTTTTLRSTTANRPTLTSIDQGQMYFDTTLDPDGKPIWWTGTAWVDATGATV